MPAGMAGMAQLVGKERYSAIPHLVLLLRVEFVGHPHMQGEELLRILAKMMAPGLRSASAGRQTPDVARRLVHHSRVVRCYLHSLLW